MANSFQDIVPPEKRTIRNVSKVRMHARRPDLHKRDFSFRSPHAPRYGLWIIAGISLLFLFFVFSFLFSGAKVIVLPKQNTTFIDAHFEAYKDPDRGALKFETMRIEKDISTSVLATGEKEVEVKAFGKIIIFNNYDSSSQRLIKNTRFETTDGRIYRINTSTVVPGRTSKEGRVIPGSVEVVVYADEPGEEYNIGLTDFVIPGFKGSPRYEGFFARSKTPMTEGFVGQKRIVKDGVLQEAQTEIRESLEKQLLAEAFAIKPEGFYLFENALFIEYNALPSIDVGGNEVEIRERAVLHGILFNEEDFARYIAENTIGGFDDNPVFLQDVESLDFSIVREDNVRPWENDFFVFILKGNARIVWVFDEDRLRNDLLGRSKDALPTILSGYPSIDQAEVILRPFWQRTFPDKERKIRIEQVLD